MNSSNCSDIPLIRYCTSKYKCHKECNDKAMLPNDYKYKWCDNCRAINRIRYKEYRSNPEVKQQGKEYKKKYRSKPGIKQQEKEYRSRPEVKERIKQREKEYRSRPEFKQQDKEYKKKYRSKPGVKQREKEYRSRPEIKERHKQYKKEYRQIKKQKTEHATIIPNDTSNLNSLPDNFEKVNHPKAAPKYLDSNNIYDSRFDRKPNDCQQKSYRPNRPNRPNRYDKEQDFSDSDSNPNQNIIIAGNDSNIIKTGDNSNVVFVENVIINGISNFNLYGNGYY